MDITYDGRVVGSVELSDHHDPRVAYSDNLRRAATAAFDAHLTSGVGIQNMLRATATSLDLPVEDLTHEYLKRYGLMHVAAHVAATDSCSGCGEPVSSHTVTRSQDPWRMTTLCGGRPVRYQDPT